MEPYQEIVVQEKADLDSRISKLVAFIAGPEFLKLDPTDRNLLQIQALSMQHYSFVLSCRIKRFI